MSLDYTTLQSTVLDQAKRADLSSQCPQFVRSCESMIRRRVQALESRITLDESDRVSEGIYTLPSSVQEVRAVYGTVNSTPIVLQNAGPLGLRSIAATDPAIAYAISGHTIEFRGVPGTDSEFELVTFGWPDALATTSTNELLTNFEDLYVYGTLFFLYSYTQDLELAQIALDVFADVVKHVNKLSQRITGNQVPAPMYNFGQVVTGSRY